MDKKNTIIGVALLLAAFAVFIFTPKPPPPPAQPAVTEQPATTGPAAGPEGSTSGTAAAGSTAPAFVASQTNTTFAALAKQDGSARVVTLANDFIEVRFTDLGGAIENVALKKYPAVKGRPEPFILNEQHTDPMLAFTQESFPGLGRTARYEIVSQKATEVVFRAVWENRIEVIRRYTILPSGAPTDKADPYQFRHELIFRNLTDQTVALPHFRLSVGTIAPVNEKDIQHLATGYNTGSEIDFINRSKLEGGGFLSMFGFGSRAPLPFIDTPVPLVWASVENQFFASILTPDQPGRGLITRRVEFPRPVSAQYVPVGVTGAAGFDVPALPPGSEAKLGFAFYTGPKEYSRLSNGDVFKQSQDKVMQFGFFKIFSQLLLSIMSTIHKWGASWGWSIVFTTLFLKIVFLPLTLSASKSAKRMQKLQPEMQALKEKYKDNPQKQQQATMELFKTHRVNPVGGCLPILITIPFFMGFFSMLQSTAELRFAEFLWAKDLSMPDTVAHIPLGFMTLPLNILPILMGITMIVQMRLTPQPSVDNAQAKMFKFMPYIFALFCYTFGAALALYSTVNGLFTIGQQLIINRMKDAPLAPVPIAAKGGKGMKNVTPKK
ncbi:MAG: membrane protein insertase YidC [Nibricoccus sp.]